MADFARQNALIEQGQVEPVLSVGNRLPKECLGRHRLMGPFNDGVIGGTTFARKAHLDP